MAAPSSSQSRQARQASTSLFKRVWLVMMRSPRASILAVLVAAAALAVAAPSPQQQVMDNNDTSWQRFVRAPSTHTVKPARIHETSGDVLNPDSLLGASTDGGVGPTVLTRQAAGDQVPMIVIDFGINVAGLLQIDFAGSTTNGRWTDDGGNKSVVQGRDTLPRPGLKLAFSETLQFLTNRSDFTRSDNANGAQKITPGTDQIAVKQDPYTWLDQLGCENGTQVCADGLHGFRYVKIYLDALDSDAPLTTSTGSVGIKSVKLLYSGLLGTPDTFTGHFECSDPDITQWWYDAVYTNDMCTDVFRANDTEPRGAASPTLLGKLVLHDGPKRDRDPYVGDLAVSALTSYLSHDVPEAARNVLEDLAIHQRDDGWIPPASINDYTLPLFDYPLWWVVCTVEYVMYTGNMSFIQTYYPTMAKALDVFYPAHTNNDTGLIEREGYGDYAFLPRSGAVTYYNALYVHALGKAASMADLLGKGEDASRWRSRAAAVGPALVKRNWDAKAGAFFDGGPCGDQAICSVHAQDGNSLAILSGVASNSSSGSASPQSILDYMSTAMAREYGNAFYDSSILDPNADFSNRVYAFISYFELAARFSISSDPKIVGSAFEELRRLYGWMATHDPTVTFWEGIGANGSPYEGGFTSMAHGWSTGIVPLMVNYVLGVTPTKPGFKGWNVRPVPGDLAWARGAVPTPSGAITVQWQMAGGGRNGLFWMQVTAPGDTSGTVAVPLPGGAKVLTLNGELVFDVQARSAARGARQDGGFVLVDVTGGKHVFVVE